MLVPHEGNTWHPVPHQKVEHVQIEIHQDEGNQKGNAPILRMVQKPHLHKCLGTQGLPSRPCSAGRRCEHSLNWRIDSNLSKEKADSSEE